LLKWGILVFEGYAGICGWDTLPLNALDVVVADYHATDLK
jgi:hypothetical protein